MESFLTAFAAWLIPNILGAITTAVICWLLLTIEAKRKNARQLPTLLIILAAAVAGVAAISAAAVLMGFTAPSTGTTGVIAGCIAAVLGVAAQPRA